MKLFKSALGAIVFVVAACLPALAAVPPAGMMKLVATVIAASNAGDAAALASLYTNDAAVVDEEAPFYFTGAGAGQTWLTGVNATVAKMKMTQFNAVAKTPTEFHVAGGAAYLVVPVVLDGTAGRKHFHETGTLTFTMRNVAGIWKISSQVWTTATASMN